MAKITVILVNQWYQKIDIRHVFATIPETL